MSEERSEKVPVPFVCQRCALPLKLDESLYCYSEHISAELNLRIHSNPDVDLESQATSFDRYTPPVKLEDSGTEFMMISSKGDKTPPLSHNLKVKIALFDTLSNNSNIDHPICEQCTDFLTEALEQQLRDTQKDYDDYWEYYESLKSDKNEPKLSELEKELSDLNEEGKRYLDELEALTKEEMELQKAIEEEQLESQRLIAQRNKHYEEYTRRHIVFVQAKEDLMSLESQMRNTKAQFEKLKKTNVFNATFHIWHKGHFGTINNLSLGRLPSAPVDWSEINAAWGQTALLLSALARKINLKFDKYRLVPYGNHSYIESFVDQKEYPLYGTGGFKFIWDNKFDHGMAAFLECLQQFMEKVEQLEKNNGTNLFCFPYRVTKGKIEDNETSYSIKTQLNSEEQWTKAMKFMLTNLKWGLAWISSQLGNILEEIETMQLAEQLA